MSRAIDRPKVELQQQWFNPGASLSVLLLIGGDIIRKAIAQLVGYQLTIPGGNWQIPITPVAFSLGWVSYAFSNLLSAAGKETLMPRPERPSLIVNCSNGFTRNNESWILSRLLQNHENKFPVDPIPNKEGGRQESIRIDVFSLNPASGPTIDIVWIIGCVTIVAQISIAIVPWVLYRNWGVMQINLAGNLLATATCALPQWTQEKWAGRKLKDEKVVGLTRGNGYQHILVLVCEKGSWDLETLASGYSGPRSETLWASLALAILWICVLINVAGLKEHAWFIIGIGSIGMLQNVYAAGAARAPHTANLHITWSSRASTILGKRINTNHTSNTDQSVDMNLSDSEKDLEKLNQWVGGTGSPGNTNVPSWLKSMAIADGVPEWLASTKLPNNTIHGEGVVGALVELEKWIPTAGLAHLPIFFPSCLRYDDDIMLRLRGSKFKEFWKRAGHTVDIRRKGEEKRRAESRGEGM